MKGFSSLMEQGGWGTHLAMIVVSGIALTFSMPWAATIGELIDFPWRPTPLVFLGVMSFMAAVVGLNRGAARAPRGPMQWRQVGALLWHVLFAHALVVPCVIYVRALMPGIGLRIPIVVGYSLLVSFAMALAAYLHQARRWESGRQSSGTHYILATVLFAIPLFALLLRGLWRRLALLSPVGAIAHFLETNSQPWSWIALGIPATACVLLLILTLIRMRRWAK